MADAVIFKTEDQLQAACVKWFDETFPKYRGHLFAVPNGGRRDARTAQTLMATGVRAGVSDLIFIADKIHFIEMKLPTGSMSPEQHRFRDICAECGHIYWLIKSKESFQYLLTDIIYQWTRFGK